MKCPDCGKELELISELTEEEKNDVKFVTSQLNICETLLKFDIDLNSFDDDSLLAYIKAATDKLAEARFLDLKTFKKIKDKYAPNETSELKINDGKLYKHF